MASGLVAAYRCFQSHRPASAECSWMKAAIRTSPKNKVVQNLYPTDHAEPEFPDQLNHSLAATAEKPFLTTRRQGLGKA